MQLSVAGETTASQLLGWLFNFGKTISSLIDAERGIS